MTLLYTVVQQKKFKSNFPSNAFFPSFAKKSRLRRIRRHPLPPRDDFRLRGRRLQDSLHGSTEDWEDDSAEHERPGGERGVGAEASDGMGCHGGGNKLGLKGCRWIFLRGDLCTAACRFRRMFFGSGERRRKHESAPGFLPLSHSIRCLPPSLSTLPPPSPILHSASETNGNDDAELAIRLVRSVALERGVGITEEGP